MWPYPLIGGKFLYLYGIMIAIGILAAFTVLFLYSKKFKIQEKLKASGVILLPMLFLCNPWDLCPFRA